MTGGVPLAHSPGAARATLRGTRLFRPLAAQRKTPPRVAPRAGFRAPLTNKGGISGPPRQRFPAICNFLWGVGSMGESRVAGEERQHVRSAIRVLRYLAAVMNRDVAD
jgi:hypothetical protein